MKKQQQEKWHLHCQKKRADTVLRVPSWYADRHRDEPQLQRDYLITSDGAVIGKHVHGEPEGHDE